MSAQLDAIERLDAMEHDLTEDRKAERGRFRVLAVIFAALAIVLVGFYFAGRGGGGGAALAATGQQKQAADQGQKKKQTDADKAEDGDAKTAEEGEKDKKAEKSEEGEEEEDTAIPVSAVEIATGEVSAYITSTANLVPENDVKILGEAEGRVAELRVEEGDLVRKGQILAVLVQDDERIALEKTELELANARMAVERARKSAASELIAQEVLDKAEVDFSIAEQGVEEARWRLEKTTIRAPFDGVVTERMMQVGKHVRMGDELFSVADFDPLVARIYLPEKDVLGLSEGRDVRLKLKADEKVAFKGRIRQVSPIVDTATGTVKVTIEVDTPPEMVRPGAFVSVNIIRETRPDAILVPREAVIRELQSAYVFIVDGDKAEKRSLKLGLEEDGHIEALSGVTAGEQVVVAGQGALKNGSEIKLIPQKIEGVEETEKIAANLER